MDAVFSWRKTRAGDLPACLALHPAKNGGETVGSALAFNAWRQLFQMTHATRTAVIEMNGKCEATIVGFGLAAFVRKSFAEAEVTNPRPGLNSRIIESIANGEPVIATFDEVRDANTQGDLQQVILDTSWHNTLLSPTQRDEVRVLLGLAYMELHVGYHFSRILSEMVDELDLWHVRDHRSFQIADRFEAYRLANPDTKWNADRALLVATLDSMRSDPHSIAAGLFQHHLEPRFAFTIGEQQLLEAALEGVDDASAASSLFVSLPAIKRRWENIFDRVGSIRPDLCPLGNGTRGIQKRQRVLSYVRNHPEELRPFNFGKHKKLEK
jgi:hypothetical protein